MIGLCGLAATAMAGGTSGCGLVVLNHSAGGALTMTGNSTVDIPTQAVYVNSSASNAVKTTGNATLMTPDLYVVGGTSFGGNSGCTGVVHQSVAPFADPLAGVMFPSASGAADLGSKSINGNAGVTLGPGYYSGGISVAGNSTVTLSPGVYLIGGGGLSITSGNIHGEGVCLVMLHGNLSIAGCSSLVLSPPASGNMAGVVIAQPSSNGSSMSLAGGSEVNITGSIYAPGALLTLTGNSSLQGIGPLMGDLVDADRVKLTGTGAVKIGRPAMPAVSLPTMPLFD